MFQTLNAESSRSKTKLLVHQSPLMGIEKLFSLLRNTASDSETAYNVASVPIPVFHNSLPHPLSKKSTTFFYFTL